MSKIYPFTESPADLISLIQERNILNPFPLICAFINETSLQLFQLFEGCNDNDIEKREITAHFYNNIIEICGIKQIQDNESLKNQIFDYMGMSLVFHSLHKNDKVRNEIIKKSKEISLQKKSAYDFTRIINRIQSQFEIIFKQKNISCNYPNARKCRPFSLFNTLNSNIKKGCVFNSFEKGQQMHLLHVSKHPHCNKHDIAISCDCRHSIPTIEYNECFFCQLKNIIHESDDDTFSDHENEEIDKEQTIYDTQAYHFENAISLNHYGSEQLHNLTPLTLQMIRYNDEQKSYPLKIIGNLLFPFLDEEQKLQNASEFTGECFDEIKKIFNNMQIEKDDNKISQNTFTFHFSFSTAIDLVLPKVWDHFLKACKLTSRGEKIEFLYPPLRSILIQFYINLSYRKKAPVIYAFLRLYNRFNDIESLEIIALTIQKIFTCNDKEQPPIIACVKDNESVQELFNRIFDSKDVENAINYYKDTSNEYPNDISIEELPNELTKFIYQWDRTLNILQSSYITSEIYEALKYIVDSFNVKVKEYFNFNSSLSYENDLPYLITNYLADGHNEFIHILEEHSSINPVSAYDTVPQLSKYMINSHQLSMELWQALAGKIDINGHITDLEGAEKQFISSISRFKYVYILNHYSNHYSKLIPQLPGTTITNQFSKVYLTREITVTQKAKLYKYVTQTNNSVGLKILIENTIRKILASSPLPKASDNMMDFIDKIDNKSMIELAAANAFNNAKIKCKDMFYVSNLLSVYKFITTDHPFFGLRTSTYLNFFYAIYKNFKSTFLLAKIPYIDINEKQVNTSTMLITLIKLMSYSIEGDHIKSKVPSGLMNAIKKDPEFIKGLKNLLNADEERDFEYIAKNATVAPYILTAFKICFNSVFTD